ncbi:MAG: hypothetical protein MJE66_05605 [Proteobacteria bacterium]|nr:hypothetical protein [Pseudomonadota bacterium]
MKRIRTLLLAAVMLAFTPGAAFATFWWHKSPACDPDSVGSGTVTIEDPTFGLYSVKKDFEVFADNNCANPVAVNGSFTYVYNLEVLEVSTLGILEFRVPVPGPDAVLEAGFVEGGPDMAPTSTEVQEIPAGSGQFFVVYSFPEPDDFLPVGAKSAPLYIVSPFQPGDAQVELEGQFALAANGPCIGPALLPEPCPCGSLFWKLRALNWWWVNHFFPGEQFGQLKTRAVELSGGFFEDEGELVSSLFYIGFLSAKRKAKRQLAALLLNVAAGELFPGNTKCRLFLGTELDLDGDDVPDSTVEEAIGDIIAGIESGSYSLQLDAFHLALDINEGKNVVGAVIFH